MTAKIGAPAFLLAAPSSAAIPLAAGAEEQRVTFDSEKSDAAPAGFELGRTGDGAPGRWIVRASKDAPSAPNVLAQVGADATDMRFPVAVLAGPLHGDVRVAVNCKPISGKVDQACGLVARYTDANNYHVTRANALRSGCGRRQTPSPSSTSSQ